MLIIVDGHMRGSLYYPLFLFICLKFSLTNSFKKTNLLSRSKALSLICPGTMGVGWTQKTILPTCSFPLVWWGIVGINTSSTYSSNITVWIWA